MKYGAIGGGVAALAIIAGMGSTQSARIVQYSRIIRLAQARQ